jgi:hypothetical protein
MGAVLRPTRMIEKTHSLFWLFHIEEALCTNRRESPHLDCWDPGYCRDTLGRLQGYFLSRQMLCSCNMTIITNQSGSQFKGL